MKFLKLIILMFITLNTFSQVSFILKQIGLQKDTLHKIIIGNFEEVLPIKVNDSTLQYILVPEKPEYLFIVADIPTRWVTRIWINPEIKQIELVLDYSKKKATITNFNEWDNLTVKIFELLDSKKRNVADSLITHYVNINPDSYFSLWILLFMSDKKVTLNHLNNLNSNLKRFPEFKQVLAKHIDKKYPKIGDSFFEFTLSEINDKLYNSNQINNKWILLHFWSNSCGPCVKEMDEIVKFYNSIDTSKITFISIALDQNKQKWKSAKTTNKITWKSLWAEDNTYCDLCLKYNLYSIPSFILFDIQKKLFFIKDGSGELENISKIFFENKLLN